jgi:hypothetical protein
MQCTMEDERVSWMSELVTTMDGVTMDMFADMVRSDPSSNKAIKAFLEGSSGTSLLFHCMTSNASVDTDASKVTENDLEKQETSQDNSHPLNVTAPPEGADATKSDHTVGLVASLNIVHVSESALEESCFYFLKVADDDIARDYESIGNFVEFGLITGENSLGRLRSLLEDVYVPLLQVGSSEETGSDPKSVSRAENILRSEFRSNMHKFCRSLSITCPLLSFPCVALRCVAFPCLALPCVDFPRQPNRSRSAANQWRRATHHSKHYHRGSRICDRRLRGCERPRGSLRGLVQIDRQCCGSRNPEGPKRTRSP